MRINRHDTDGNKPLLGKGELGYDDYQAGGDAGRVYVGTGTENIPAAKKSEVMAVDSKADAHISRIDNPHGVTKAQVGLGLVDNTADVNKKVLSATKWTTARTITLSGDIAGSASIDGSADVTIATTVQPNSVVLGTDTTGNYVAGATAGTGISISGSAGEGWSPTITNTAPNVTTDITTTHNTTNVVVNSSDGTDGTINGATQTLAGVMTAADKVKLDSITTGATANTGTVTSIATSGAITGGTITSTGTISHSTADGYLHVPATGTTNSGKVLTAGTTAGSLSWTALPSAPVTSVAGKTGAVTLVKDDVGLGSVDNTSDATKNVLSATKLTTPRAIALTGDVTGTVNFDGSAGVSITATVVDDSHNHVISNVDGLQTALDAKVDDAEKGAANGIATLDANGKVALTQIPDSVLGQLEYMGTWNLTTFPTATQKGQYWVASVSGNGYVVGDWAVWNGTAFDKVDNTDAVATVAGRTGNVILTKSDVGLANVDNTADSAKPVSIAQQTALNLKAPLVSPTLVTPNIGVATGTSFNSITGLSSTTPSVAGTAAIGTSTTVARADHVHPVQTSVSGNAGTATKLTTARTISLTGDVTGSVSFDGSSNASITATIAANSVALGTDTTGNYVAEVTAGQGITISGTAGEGWSPTIALSALDLTLFPTSNFKKSVKVATTANITLSGVQTIDGISVVAGDRVLVKDQTTASQNGIYIVNASTWTRSVAANGANEIDSAVVGVDQGTTNGGRFFTNMFKTTDTVGTTAMPWYEVATTSSTVSLAKTLATARTVQTNLGSTASASFNGSANITPGVTGTLPVSNGGTGATTLTGLVKGNGTSAMSAAVAGTDYVVPSGSITGNASTATTLQTARTISGVSFNGSANIDIEDRLGTAIASAATTTIGTRGLGDYIHITGTTTITSFGTAAAAGVRRTLIFDGALTLTHNATSLICPGAANIVTVAGTIIEVVAETTANWRVVSITHSSLSMAELGYLDGVTSSIQTQFNGKVSKTGNETVSGVKTFSSSPIVPNATTATQAMAYGQGVNLTGAQTIAGVKTFTDELKLQGQNVSPFSGFKNYIINGNFNVWQRGTSFNGLTNGSYSADRWVVYDSIGDINYNVIRNAGIFTGGYGATYTWNSGTGQRSIIQFIENVTRFKVGSSVTVSFEAYTNSTPYSIGVAIQAVRGVWASVTSVVSSPIALTNTKAKYSVTLSVPDWSSIGIDWAHLEDTKLALKFDLAADTNGKDFIISNVQLEEGSVATPFEQRPYGLELSLCQRYYMPFTYVGGGQSFSSSIHFTFPLFRTMRVIPTLTNKASSYGSGAMFSTYGSSAATTYIEANSATANLNGSVGISVSGNVEGVASISISGTASAEL